MPKLLNTDLSVHVLHSKYHSLIVPQVGIDGPILNLMDPDGLPTDVVLVPEGDLGRQIVDD